MKRIRMLGSSEAVARSIHVEAEERTPSKLNHLPLKLLRFGAVRERTGLSRSTVWRLERQGAFPKHIKISANIVAWLEEEIADWIHRKVGTAEETGPSAGEALAVQRR